jgi:hypothetical protein
MYLIIGQETEMRIDALRAIKSSVERDGCGSGLFGCVVNNVDIVSLKWAIKIFIAPQKLEEWSMNNPRAAKVLEMVRNVCRKLGKGRYVFRGGENEDLDVKLPEFSDVWDKSLNFIVKESDVFGGIPMTMIISTEYIVEIPFYWVNEFVQNHYSHPIPPRISNIVIDDKLRLVLDAVRDVLSLEGAWLFKLIYSRKINNMIIGNPTFALSRTVVS